MAVERRQRVASAPCWHHILHRMCCRAFEDQKREQARSDKEKEAARKLRQKDLSDDLTKQVTAHAAKSAHSKAHEMAIGEQLAVRGGDRRLTIGRRIVITMGMG